MPEKLRKFGIPALIGFALLLPLLFASPVSETRFHLGLPRVYSGDEVHYLLTINSVIRDRDLDLSNNYAAVHAGADQAGNDSRGRALDHHTVWFVDGVRMHWWQNYETERSRWDRDADGRPVPRLREGKSPIPPGHPEYSTHPPGLALLLAPLLFAVRNTPYVESLAICCSAVAVIAAMLMFCALARKYNPDLRAVHLAALVAFLGTPAWHYARTLFAEPYLLLFAIGAYSIALRGKSPLLAGLFIGLGLMVKSPFALLIVPLCLMYLAARDFVAAALLTAPVAVSLTAYLMLNDFMFGSPLTAAQPWLPGSFVDGALGSLFSGKYGIVIVAPAILAAFAAWPYFFRTHPRDAIVLASGILLHFSLYASYRLWAGATCYGPRYVVPLLPLIVVPLVCLPGTRVWQRRWARYSVIAICALSVAMNGIAAMAYWAYWDTNPIRIAVQKIFGITLGG
jgi:hypothetical protein